MPKSSSLQARVIGRTATEVEIEITASQAFPPRAMPPVLLIGSHTFGSSHYPQDGRADTLIFTVDAAEFDALEDNLEVNLGYLSSKTRLRPPGTPTIGRSLAASGARPVSQLGTEDVVRQRRIGQFRKNQSEVQP